MEEAPEDVEIKQRPSVRFEEGSQFTIDTASVITRRRKAQVQVSLESLMVFLFPPGLQHPLSTGRLFAFGLYGPLDENSQLRSGHKGQHIVQRFELDAMCQRFEREIILQVYLGSDSFELLSESEVEAVIAQADRRTKVAKGKSGMPQVSREEAAALFADLPRDADGRLSFHDMQRKIVEYREQKIAELKVIFPELMGGGGGGATGSPAAGSGAKAAKEKRRQRRAADPQQAAVSDAGEPGSGGGGFKLMDAGRQAPVSAKKKGLSRRVAPPEMFQKGTGFTEMEMSSQVNQLLSKHAFRITDIEHGNASELTQNVQLLREIREPDDGRKWDSNSCLRGSNIGGHVKTAKSATTVKRKC
mmetsp:Transcript_40499/g.66259  ORF Transcript_40499/g.66259 Transcript_40499/m.66259 type:complete len:359 (-) Transcript_40499:261-1337(-)